MGRHCLSEDGLDLVVNWNRPVLGPGELVVGEEEDVQVEEGGEGAGLDVGEVVVLQVEDLQALLPVEQLPVQLGQRIVA